MALVQALNTLRLFESGDIAIVFPPRGARLAGVAQWTASFALARLLLAAFSAPWTAKPSRLQYFTKEWVNTIQFLIADPQFLDADKNGKKFVRTLTILCPAKGPHYERSRDPT